MSAEFQVLSPLVSTRETHFLRYCQQNAEEGTWAIVDFPVDSFHQNFHPSYPRYCRRSSGCVIQDMPNGYSRVSPKPIGASNYIFHCQHFLVCMHMPNFIVMLRLCVFIYVGNMG